MKFNIKFCLSIIVFIFISLQNLAWAENESGIYYSDEGKPYDYKLWERNGKVEQKVREVGYRLLNSNKVKNRIKFSVKWTTAAPNAYALDFNSNIILYSTIFPYIDNDDELAALLAHEISHIQQFNKGWWTRTKMNFYPKKYEEMADNNAVDLLVHANYNPLAMLSFYNKSLDEYRNYKKINILTNLFIPPFTHPNGSKRLGYVYNYIIINYPQYIAKGYDNLYYVNFLMNTEKNQDILKIKNKHEL